MFGEYMTLNGYDVFFLVIMLMIIGFTINVGTKEILKVLGRTHDLLDEDIKVIQQDLRIVKAKLERMSDD